MFDIFLLVFFSVFVLISGIKILKKNVLFGGCYFFLYLYSIFAQIGYCFFPEFSELIYAYFGEEYFYKFYFFNFLSFLSFYLLFKFRFPLLRKRRKYDVVKVFSSLNYLFFLVLIFCFLVYQTYYLITYNDSITYTNASNPDFLASSNLMYFIFSVGFKFMAAISLIFYSQLRLKKHFKYISYASRPLIFMFFISTVTLFFIIANQLGNRTDILAFVLGLLAFEYLLGFNLKKFFRLIILLLPIFFILIYIQSSRSNSINEGGVAQIILINDYFSPAHMLYSAMGLGYIDTIEVITSNLSNILFKLNYPYLQEPITEMINPGVANRSQGYAFYLFTEGFIFMGYLGFLYNSFMLYFGLSVWYRLQNSNNSYYSIIFISIMCTQFANLARSQSSYFFKDIYMFFIPVLFLVFLSSGLRPKF